MASGMDYADVQSRQSCFKREVAMVVVIVVTNGAAAN